MLLGAFLYMAFLWFSHHIGNGKSSQLTNSGRALNPTLRLQVPKSGALRAVWRCCAFSSCGSVSTGLLLLDDCRVIVVYSEWFIHVYTCLWMCLHVYTGLYMFILSMIIIHFFNWDCLRTKQYFMDVAAGGSHCSARCFWLQVDSKKRVVLSLAANDATQRWRCNDTLPYLTYIQYIYI